MVEPGNALLSSVEGIDQWNEIVLAGKGVQVDDQGCRCQIEARRAVEESPSDRAKEGTVETRGKPGRQVRNGVVDQARQATDHLQRSAMETRPARIGALLVVSARGGVEEGVVDLNTIVLLLMLALAEGFDDLAGVLLAGGVEGVPAVLFGPGDHVAANNRPGAPVRGLPL